MLPSCRYDSERRASFSQCFARKNLVRKNHKYDFYFDLSNFLSYIYVPFQRIYWRHLLSSISRLSSFISRFRFILFYFQKSIIDILHNLIMLKLFYLFTNRNNLKTEIRLTTLHGIPFFKNLNYCYEISGFKHLNICRFRNTRLICQVIWFIRTATVNRWCSTNGHFVLLWCCSMDGHFVSFDAAVRTNTLSHCDAAVRTWI